MLKLFLNKIYEESKKPKMHLEHIEDLMLNLGYEGLEDSITILEKIIYGEDINITLKVDGKPAIIFGINPENDQFFIGTKRALTKPAHSEEEIKEIYSDNPELVSILTGIFPYLQQAMKDKKTYMGDLMFSPEIPVIEQEDYLSFTPNTIEYRVDKDSTMGHKIKSSTYGIIVHTILEGETKSQLNDPSLVFNNVNNLWIGGVQLKKTNTINVLKDQLSKIKQLQAQLLKNTKYFEVIDKYKNKIKSYFVKAFREGTATGEGALKRLMDTLESQYKSEKGKAEIINIMQDSEFRRWAGLLLHIYSSIGRLKDEVIKHLVDSAAIKAFVDGKPHGGEGFVATKNGKMAKLVDRKQFSDINYMKWSAQESYMFSEGGAAIKDSVRIPKSETPQLIQKAKNLLVSLGVDKNKISEIGSAGKKEDSGDIDLAIEASGIIESNDKIEAGEKLTEKLQQAGYNPVYMKGLGTISIGLEFGDNYIAQIDFMIVPDLEWAKFGYYSPHPDEKENHKWGLARNLLLYQLIKNVTQQQIDEETLSEYMWTVNDGFQYVERQKDNKGKWKIVNRGPKKYTVSELIQVLGKHGLVISKEDLDTLSSVLKIVDTKLSRDLRDAIIENTIETLTNMKKPIPELLKNKR